MKRTTVGSDSERQRSDRQREPDGGLSDGAGRGSAAALHRAVGNQAVQRGTDGDDQSRATADDGGSTADSVETEMTASGVQRQSTTSRSGGETATAADRDAATELCPRCARRYRAGKALDCPDCEATLQRSVDPAARSGTVGGVVQPKLTVSQPGDPAEREAERVADEVVGMDNAGDVTVSRQATSGSGTVDADTESQIQAAMSSGRTLPESTRSAFESRFDRDFSDVRIHTGPQADAAARSIDAEAFTVGSDIVFARGNYRPNSAAGRQLLAHELTHVVQQEDGSGGSGALQRRSDGYSFSVNLQGCDKEPYNEERVERAAREAFETVRDSDCVKSEDLEYQILTEFNGLDIECHQTDGDGEGYQRCGSASPVDWYTQTINLYKPGWNLECGPLNALILHEVVHSAGGSPWYSHGPQPEACQNSCFGVGTTDEDLCR